MIDFRWIFLPYCLERLEDGSYVVLNRNYKPVGMTVEKRVRYEDYPVRIRFKRLTPQRIAKISWSGSTDAAKIWLYNDGCIPTDSAEHWQAYQQRLKLLTETAIEAVAAEPRLEDAAGQTELLEIPGFPVFRAKREDR